MRSDKEEPLPYDTKRLHGRDYVERFKRGDNESRLKNILANIDVEKRDTVIDYGCGIGVLMSHIAPSVEKYIGVDFSEEFIEAANERKKESSITNAEMVCSSISEFSNSHKQNANIAFALDLSEHVDDKSWLQSLIDIRATLVPGGILYLHTPNSQYFLEIMKDKNIIIKQFPEHIAVRSVEQNIDLLERAGFKVRSIKILPHYNILKYLHFLSYLPILGKYFKARIFISCVA